MSSAKRIFWKHDYLFFYRRTMYSRQELKWYFEWADGLENEIIDVGDKLSELRTLFQNNTNSTIEKYVYSAPDL